MINDGVVPFPTQFPELSFPAYECSMQIHQSGKKMNRSTIVRGSSFHGHQSCKSRQRYIRYSDQYITHSM